MAHTKQLQQKIHQKLQSGQFEAHTLESLPLTHLFHVLWEGSTNWCLTHRVSRPAQDKSSFLLRRIPDTVVWENNIPKGWYRYEEEMEEGTDGQKVKVGNIKKDKVDTKKVDYSFTNGKHDDDIVAMYLAKALDGVKEIIRIDYLTTTNLRAFLFSRNRGKGTCLLQRWVEPQNREFNDVIQAVWTSSLKCLVERRRNKTHLLDERVCLRERCVTFDGPPHLSSTTNLSPRLTEQVSISCASIAEHFKSNVSLTRQQPKHEITRMIVQFKIDSNCHLVLLGVLGVRVPNRLRKKDLFVALDLAPVYQHITHAVTDESSETINPTSGQRRVSIQTVEAPEEVENDEDDFASWLAGRVKARRRSTVTSTPWSRRQSKVQREPSKRKSKQPSLRMPVDHSAWKGNTAIWGKQGGGFITRDDIGVRKSKEPKLRGTEKRILEKLIHCEEQLTNKIMPVAKINMLTKMMVNTSTGPEVQIVSKIKEQFFRGLNVAPTAADVDNLESTWCMLSSHIQKRRQTETKRDSNPKSVKADNTHTMKAVSSPFDARHRWQLLRTAVKSRFILPKISSQTLIHDLTDAVYMLESNKLLRKGEVPFSFTVRSVPEMLTLFLDVFIDSINATEIPTDNRSERTYIIEARDILPVHTCDIALQTAVKNISKALNTRQQAVLRNDGGGAAHILYALGSLTRSQQCSTPPPQMVSSPVLGYDDCRPQTAGERIRRSLDDIVEDSTWIDDADTQQFQSSMDLNQTTTTTTSNNSFNHNNKSLKCDDELSSSTYSENGGW